MQQRIIRALCGKVEPLWPSGHVIALQLILFDDICPIPWGIVAISVSASPESHTRAVPDERIDLISPVEISKCHHATSIGVRGLCRIFWRTTRAKGTRFARFTARVRKGAEILG